MKCRICNKSITPDVKACVFTDLEGKTSTLHLLCLPQNATSVSCGLGVIYFEDDEIEVTEINKLNFTKEVENEPAIDSSAERK